MAEGIPSYAYIVFILTTILTLAMFLAVVRTSKYEVKGVITFLTGCILVAWLGIQGILSLKGFYLEFETLPPRFMIALLPPLLVIAIIFSWKKTRMIALSLKLSSLTYVHVIRIPVEIVLYWLFLQKLVPELITFEGRSFDIISGITAPIIGFFCFSKRKWNPKIGLIWNCLALILLVNVVGHAILSTPYPFQVLSFEMPNTGVMYFPFIWLPSFIVPVVFFCHIISIAKLIGQQSSRQQ